MHRHCNCHDGHGQIQQSNQHRQRIAPSNGSSTFSVFAFLVDGMNHQTCQHQRHFKTLRSLLANGGKLDNDGQRQENHHRPYRDVRLRVTHARTCRPNGSSNANVSSSTRTAPPPHLGVTNGSQIMKQSKQPVPAKGGFPKRVDVHRRGVANQTGVGVFTLRRPWVLVVGGNKVFVNIDTIIISVSHHHQH